MNTVFAWTDDEQGAFDPEYFNPVEIPYVSHMPWVHRQGLIPWGILDQVVAIIKDKISSRVYEPSSSSYNSRWFCILKKDGTSLHLVHSLEPLNAITIKDATAPPYTDVIAEDFAGRAIYTTLNLCVFFDQRQLHPNSCNLTTFTTLLGAQWLGIILMGWTGSPAILQGDITRILHPEIPKVTVPFMDDLRAKGPKMHYELEDGTYAQGA